AVLVAGGDHLHAKADHVRQAVDDLVRARHVPSDHLLPFDAELVEQRFLHHSPLAHHRLNLLFPRRLNQMGYSA
ncbi:hypothetical protein NKH10_24050, partial [Mesorhizobium sp. M1340]|uniref:hypothetical protein n=1 Tax=Mesorhizobium sp. M1340 TaxID=2957087 RepID=UPI0033365350